MEPIETLDNFRQFLSNDPTPLEVWKVFKKLGKEKVECEEDYLLFQIGNNDITKTSCMDFCRSFLIWDEEGSWWEQVHAEFTINSPEILNMRSTDLSSEDFFSLEDFFKRVEKMEEFQRGINVKDWSFDLYHKEL